MFGLGTHGEGVHGDTNSTTFSAVTGIVLNTQGTGSGVFGQNRGLARIIRES